MSVQRKSLGRGLSSVISGGVKKTYPKAFKRKHRRKEAKRHRSRIRKLTM